MPYKISGSLEQDARIIMIKESDWSIESNTQKTAGNYEIECEDAVARLIAARKSDGETPVYGYVIPKYYAPNGLMLHYDFEQITGTTVPDMVSNNDATIVGTKSEVEGIIYLSNPGGTALEFTSNSDYAMVAGYTNSTTEGTIMFWVKLNSAFSSSSPDHLFPFCYYNSNSDRMVIKFDRADGKLKYIHYIGTDLIVESDSASWNRNQWYHVAVTHGGETTYMYINGSQQTDKVTRTQKWFDDITSGTIYLGVEEYSGSIQNTLNGVIDDFRIYNYALTENEVLDIYASGIE